MYIICSRYFVYSIPQVTYIVYPMNAVCSLFTYSCVIALISLYKDSYVWLWLLNTQLSTSSVQTPLTSSNRTCVKWPLPFHPLHLHTMYLFILFAGSSSVSARLHPQINRWRSGLRFWLSSDAPVSILGLVTEANPLAPPCGVLWTLMAASISMSLAHCPSCINKHLKRADFSRLNNL